jgi:hypothetical protein
MNAARKRKFFNEMTFQPHRVVSVYIGCFMYSISFLVFFFNLYCSYNTLSVASTYTFVHVVGMTL